MRSACKSCRVETSSEQARRYGVLVSRATFYDRESVFLVCGTLERTHYLRITKGAATADNARRCGVPVSRAGLHNAHNTASEPPLSEQGIVKIRKMKP